MNIFVTGNAGFIGRHLVERLLQESCNVILPNERIDLFSIPHLSENFAGCDVVIHCAGYAHANNDNDVEFSHKHWSVNYQGATNVAYAAARANVKRLVFISTVKAVGDNMQIIIHEGNSSTPNSPYGKAKRAAETELKKICNENNMEWVIVRPVMVYGRDGKGNLPRMWSVINKGYFPPLPKGGERSLIHIDDVADALVLVADHPQAAGEVFILAHPNPVSSKELFRMMREISGMKSLHWCVPNSVLKALAQVGNLLEKLLKKPMPFNQDVYDKLMNPAIYSSEKIEKTLGWKAKVGLDEGLRTIKLD